MRIWPEHKISLFLWWILFKRSRFVTEDTQENYRIVDSSAKLLERFRSGTKQVTVEYREQNENGEIFWLQKTVLMSQDTVYNSETGKEKHCDPWYDPV